MNMTTATHRLQAISALSLALLISGTASANHKSDSPGGERHRHEYGNSVQSTPSCRGGRQPTLLNIGTHQNAQRCAVHSEATAPAPIRLAKPLSGSPYRSDDNVRYSF